MADEERDRDFEFIDSMTADEMHSALAYLSGRSPDGFAAVKAHIIRMRGVLDPPGTERHHGPDGPRR